MKYKMISYSFHKLTLVILILFLHISNVFGFKPKTHVWIAQQVLNDVLLDGKLTINGRDYEVSKRIVDALRAHASTYRMGHVGPDAFPDILVGQTVVHPGRKGGWQTDDWLQWSVREAGDDPAHIAYALGMLGHAAGDIWAHSYVNMYAGDAFSLIDGETDVEVRHIAVETFIDKYTPALRDHNGHTLGSVQDNIAAPVGFLSKHLILASDPSREYQNSNTGVHLVAMRKVWNAIYKAQKASEGAGSDVQKLILKLENEVIEITRKANDLVGPIAQAKQQLVIANAALEQHERLIDAQKKIIEEQNRIIRQSEQIIIEAGELSANLPGKIANVQNEIVGVQRSIALTPSKLSKKVCDVVTKKLPWPFNKIVEETVCKVVDIVNPAYENLVNLISDLEKQKNTLTASLQAATLRKSTAIAAKAAATTALAAASVELARLEAIKKSNNAGRELAKQAKEALDKLEKAQKDLFDQVVALKGKIDEYRVLLSQELNPVSLALKHWEGDLIKAIDAYENANFAVMKAILTSENPLTPLQQWVDCWAPVFMAVPKEVPGTACVIKHGIEEIRSLRSKLRKALGPGGWLIDPAGMTEDILVKELTPALEDATIQIAMLIDGNLGALIKMHIDGISDQQLNAVFSNDATNKQLLLIPDVANRLLADMRVHEGSFNTESFAPAYNAVILAKLSLLDANALNSIAKELGIKFPTRYGTSLYEGNIASNVLFGVVRSIDGNHQWQAYAPAFPRSRPNGDGYELEDRRYGYSFDKDGSSKGMRFYSYNKTESRAFAKLFTGPLSPALETPDNFGFSNILPKWYVAGTVKNPFPKTPSKGRFNSIFRSIF
ncbi:hypothetical protein [Adhaeribacter radiodurans]|uniref:Zinc dependent phospholipase C family protein n=1 Tax=Adhaeribacter radiodurans TaxID=2745197 RepID=A0A7L7LCL2_9BACT|nr:hypothetical protein [Adhaeribacter radiodurans]QMU30513.1 hypothetical protein HUW48_21915 [Adhaeribacter radiodurans]